PVVPLTERNAGTSSRLPTVTAPVTGPATDAATPVANPAATRPIERFAAPFEAPGDLPLMAIVLIDDDAAIGVEALADFPYPLTFAIDPTAPDAAEKMARHRAAGFEVLALVNLTPTATPRDAEAALELGFSTLDQAVGLIEGTDDGIQGNRPLSDQVTAILRDKGYGLVTQNVGLNTVANLARRDGVPAAPVFRDFDGAGQTPTVMRRFLDQAAFRAGQEGSVIMLGRVRPDTVSALLLWGLQDRAGRVALAPVSAVLLETPPAE
ncbi:MAG: divergent polysaccharide deacetylase family protein, partial [Rhodobacteraceae bacterium]